ncbi:zona pellucida sperm-binding protein 3-like [Bombina bombina]|uniref:zona pellucida sperm-binding protein 3-like n=1 Tax=Bombina bombina TaxID=8345 RepID=UPI00235AAB76|nr:zona pellucida sperm-binding protein 3-like [Bombina bombina]
MVVTVQRDLYGKGKLVKASDLTLGTQRCQPSPQSTNALVMFQNRLQECGSELQMTPEFLIYRTSLTYNPTPVNNAPIIRTNSAVVQIECYYPRHDNVSSNAIRPTWNPFSSTVSVQEKLDFSLQLMNDDWSAQRVSTVFQLGDVFNIQASLATNNHVPMMVFVDSCVATSSPDLSSTPRYDIIALNGCLMDGRQEDSSSAFRSPRPRSDILQFTVDAFRFSVVATSTIYITCNLRAAAASQTPDPENKACSFNKASNIWSPVEGTREICRCCDSGNCVSPQSRRLGRIYPGPRNIGKRETRMEEEHGLATLGPLMVTGADHGKALAVTLDSNSKPLDLWLFITIGSLSFSVEAAVALIGVWLIKKLVLQSRRK